MSEGFPNDRYDELVGHIIMVEDAIELGNFLRSALDKSLPAMVLKLEQDDYYYWNLVVLAPDGDVKKISVTSNEIFDLHQRIRARAAGLID